MKSFIDIFKDFFTNYPKFKVILAIFGGIGIFRKILTISLLLYRNFLRPSHNLAVRYGLGSYIVISGSFSEIFKVFSEEFAKMKFNLIFILTSKEQEDGIEAFTKNLQDLYQIHIKVIDLGLELLHKTGLDSLFKEFNVSILINLNNTGYLT